MMACPFNIPRYEWDSAVPAVRKCDMCFDRQERGRAHRLRGGLPYEATMCGHARGAPRRGPERASRRTPTTTTRTSTARTRSAARPCSSSRPFPVEELGFDGEARDGAAAHLHVARAREDPRHRDHRAAPRCAPSGGSPTAGTRFASRGAREAREDGRGRREARRLEPRGERTWPPALARPLSFWRGMFYLLLGTGLVLTVIRFTQGLGAVTNLTDQLPVGPVDRLRPALRRRPRGRRLRDHRRGLHLPHRAPAAHRAADHADRLPRLPAGHRGPAVRPRPALEHLAPARHVEPALRDVRGRLVRDALQHGAGARVLRHGVREVPAGSARRRSRRS